jgi:hypothetical protein
VRHRLPNVPHDNSPLFPRGSIPVANCRLPQFSPHIGAAILAKKPWLRLLCPACQQQGAVDLRRVVRPADYPIAGLYDALTCTFGPCRGDGPRPVMLGLFASRDAPLAKPSSESA